MRLLTQTDLARIYRKVMLGATRFSESELLLMREVESAAIDANRFALNDAFAEMLDILETYESNLGSRRETCDAAGKLMWDRIQSVRGVLKPIEY